MVMNTPAKLLAALVLTAVLGPLAACADLPYRQPGERAAELPADKGLIAFAAEGLDPAPAKRIQYSDNEQRVEYALYKGNARQAEFIFMERPYYSVHVSFNFPYTIRDKVETWNFSKGQAVEWDEAVYLRTKLGMIFYRSYRLVRADRRCFGMSGEWDVDGEDTSLRPLRVMFGYYCAGPGEKLPEKDIFALLDGIGLRGVTERAANYADPVLNFHRDVAAHYGGPEGTARALELAQGTATPDKAGIPEFPFRYAEYFVISAGSDISN